MACLQEPASASAAKIIGLFGPGVNEVFFTNTGLEDIAHVICNRIAKGLADQVAWILNGELYFQVLVPVGRNLYFAFVEPPGVETQDGFNLEIVRNLEFFQSEPDCIKFVSSLGVEPVLAAEVIHRLGLDPDDLFPFLFVGSKHAVIFSSPAKGPVSPVGSGRVHDFP